jgi:hypothetical protein
VDVQMEWLSAVAGNEGPQWLSPRFTAGPVPLRSTPIL